MYMVSEVYTKAISGKSVLTLSPFSQKFIKFIKFIRSMAPCGAFYSRQSELPEMRSEGYTRLYADSRFLFLYLRLVNLWNGMCTTWKVTMC